jgi:methylthioribose-1-phosphate isomerase
MNFKTIEWLNDKLRIIDQTCLPEELVYRDCETVEDVWDAIKRLQVRGAPAIGIAGAFALYLGMRQKKPQSHEEWIQILHELVDYLGSCRPTAVNLQWALDRVRERVLPEEDIQLAKALLLRTAQNILLEDQDLCQRIGLAGAELLNDGDVILTHCNAGALATSGIGTALSVIYKAQEQGKNVKVFADETRPLLQGSRLTAWELAQNSVDVTVITDNMAAHVIRDKGVKVIIVGADRIVANGDVANKIGTYNLAVLAEKHKIPFYVAAPFSTFDIALASGQEIAIEERESYEIENGFGKQTVPKGVRVYNPAFDMTPHELVTALITDQGVLYPPFDVKIVRLNSGEALSSQKIL